MKNKSIVQGMAAVLFLFLVLNSGCVVHPHHVVVVTPKSKPAKMPPGQMKKATGSQSAKPYAPGQQKKDDDGKPSNHGQEKKESGDSGKSSGQGQQKKKKD